MSSQQQQQQAPRTPKMRLVLMDTSEKKAVSPWGKEKKPTLGPRRIFGNAREEAVNFWFYTPWEDNNSPFLFGIAVVEEFNNSLKKHDLELCLEFKAFRKSLFSAICSFRYNGAQFSGLPRNLPKPPKGWSSPTEEIWQDYLQSSVFHTEFWDQFWHLFPMGIWEEEEYNIRNYLQSILPFYIKRDKELLLENELIAVNSEGDYVDPLEVDYEEEESFSKWD